MKKYLILLLLASCNQPLQTTVDLAKKPIIVSQQKSVENIIENTTYFSLDSSQLSTKARNKLIINAKLLNKNKDINIIIEGHCDERGTREYNLALGERRAYAVKNFLIAQQVSQARIKTISYGEEKPAIIGSNQKAYQANRRAKIIIK
jgi:peptidoglycan-associated lipoprotein